MGLSLAAPDLSASAQHSAATTVPSADLTVTPTTRALSARLFRPCQQLAEVVVYARDAEVRLAPERASQIAGGGSVSVDLHERKDEVVRLVEGGQDLVARYRHNGGTGGPAFNL